MKPVDSISLPAAKRSAGIFFRDVCQLLLLGLIWFLSDWTVRHAGIPVPGGVAGLFVLWLLLGTGCLPVTWIRGGARHLLAHLLLFFVPPMLALLNHPELLGWMGLKLLLAIIAGVPLVMAGTALVVDAGFRWKIRHER